MSAISTWSTTAASNNSSPPDGFPEGMAPSAVNNSAREVMAAVRTQHEQACWIDYGHTPTRTADTTFTVTGDQTGTYTVGRRIRATDSATLYGTITASAYTSLTTVTVSLDSGALSASLTAVALGILDSNCKITTEQVAAGEGILNSELIPDGTTMVFYQAVAPTGWTEDSIQADSALRVVSVAGATGGTYGGSAGFSALAHTHADTLAAPAHTHSVPKSGWGYVAGGSSNQGTLGSADNIYANVQEVANNNTTGPASSTTLVGSVTTANISPKYMDVIVCTKDA